jgi:DtxR family Mn-dependent transcriptional regulator
MPSSTHENYLKAIYHLLEEGKSGVSTTELAAFMLTSPASVTDMLKKLSARKLIHYRKYHGVKLTVNGRKAALSVIRSHRLWEVFLVSKLRYGWDEVHELAEQLEHVKSPSLVSRLEEFLGFPRFDPHGDPIPDHAGKLPAPKGVRLSELPSGKQAKVISVLNTKEEYLRYLSDAGIKIGSEIKLLKMADFDKSCDILLNRKHKLTLSHEAARFLCVELKRNVQHPPNENKFQHKILQ